MTKNRRCGLAGGLEDQSDGNAPALPYTAISRSWQLLSLQQVPLLRDDLHCAELIPANLVEPDSDAQLERAHQIESAPDEQSLLRALGGVQPVQRAMVAALAVFLRRVGAQAGIAQFLAAQRPMHQEAKRRIIRPLPG